MDPSAQLPADVARFIENQIDSVPHMEALLLLWQSSPEAWGAKQLASRIYVSSDTAGQILRDLARRKLARVVSENPDRFAYDGDALQLQKRCRDFLCRLPAARGGHVLVNVLSRPCRAVPHQL